jgi:micrococcal nuclease
MTVGRLSAAFALVLAFAWSWAPAVVRAQEEAVQAFSCTVAFVIDGDSCTCRAGTKVRLRLVDAPESGPFGDLARRALVGLLPVGETFRIETDRESRDKQGRLLGYVFLEDGQMVNELMIRQGYAFLKPSEDNRRYLPRLREAETAARETRRGLWAR